MSELLSNEQRGTLELFCNKHRRLISKVRKLKRENLILSDRRKSILSANDLEGYYSNIGFVVIKLPRMLESKEVLKLINLSEKIGSNGLKIRHLRTKIQKLKSDYFQRSDKVE